MVNKVKVSVIIPTLNEYGSIKQVIDDIPKKAVDQILIVDGGSIDGTVELVKKMGYNVIPQEGNGLGMAVKTALKHIRGDIIIFLDADGSHEPKQILELIQKINDGYDVVIASRYLDNRKSYDDTFIRAIGNRFFILLCKLLYGFKVNDVLMGYKAFRREVFEGIRIDSPGQEYDAQVMIRAKKKGFRIGEIPTIEKKRKYGKSKLRTWYHGYQILKVIITEFFRK